MEFTNVELTAVQGAIQATDSKEARELESLELALVGGGMGDVVFA